MKPSVPLRPFLSGLLLLAFPGAPVFAAAPALDCKVANGQATLTWPLTGDSYVLESSPDLGPGVWPVVPTEPTEAAGKLSVSLPLELRACFFRLRWSDVATRISIVANDNDPDLRQIVPGSYDRPTSDPSPSGGLLPIPFAGSFGNTFDAGYTTVPGTDHSKLSFEWKFFYPENRNGGVEFIDLADRIQGVDTPSVTILANALPDLGGVAGENEWRVRVKITNNAGPTPQVTDFRFRFRYVGSGFSAF